MHENFKQIGEVLKYYNIISEITEIITFQRYDVFNSVGFLKKLYYLQEHSVFFLKTSIVQNFINILPKDFWLV
jgi:hypothetical protein